MSVPTYTPSQNNDQAGVERVFGLPQEFDTYSATVNSALLYYHYYCDGNPIESGDKAVDLRTLVSTNKSNIYTLTMYCQGDPLETGDDAKSLRTLIEEIKDAIDSLDARVTALENQN